MSNRPLAILLILLGFGLGQAAPTVLTFDAPSMPSIGSLWTSATGPITVIVKDSAIHPETWFDAAAVRDYRTTHAIKDDHGNHTWRKFADGTDVSKELADIQTLWRLMGNAPSTLVARNGKVLATVQGSLTTDKALELLKKYGGTP